MQDNDLLAIAERERAAFLEERNQTRRELDSVRERMNRLAVECERLAKAAAENQEAADTLRLIEAIDPYSIQLCTSPITGYHEWQITRRNSAIYGSSTACLRESIRRAAKSFGITLPAQEDTKPDYISDLEMHPTANVSDETYQRWLEKAAAPEPQRTEEAGEKKRERYVFVDVEGPNARELAEQLPAYLNGQSPVHKELEEARKEITNLNIALNESNDTIERYTKRLVECDKDREAWEAVDRHAINVECWGMFKYRAIRYSGPSREVLGKVEGADPRDAVLALAKELEGKQAT